MPHFPGRTLDVTRQARTFSGMAHGKKKFSHPREAPKKGPPLGLVIALAAIGGMVIGSAGTYFFSKPSVAPQQQPASSFAAGGTPQAPQKQYTPAPQPPGEAPPGKVWSVEHGHWHDAPVATTIPAPATPATVTPTPETTPTPAPATATPPAATTTPAPDAAPTEKKE